MSRTQRRVARWLVVAAAMAVLVVSHASPVRGETPVPPPDPARLVYDAAQVLPAGDRDALEQRCDELRQMTGVTVVVLTVPRLDGETIDELAVRVGQSWGVGRQGDDRGVVIALAVEDRAIHVATGYGVEEYLNDAKVGRLLDEHAMAALRRGELGAGLLALAAVLSDEAARHYGATLTRSGRLPSALDRAPALVDTIGGVLVVLIFLYLLVRHPRLLVWLLFMGGRASRGGSDRHGGGLGGSGFGGGGFGGGGAGRKF